MDTWQRQRNVGKGLPARINGRDYVDGGLVAPVLTYFAIEMNMGFAMPMLISTSVFLVLVAIAVLLGPETKGKHLTADLEVFKAAD